MKPDILGQKAGRSRAVHLPPQRVQQGVNGQDLRLRFSLSVGNGRGDRGFLEEDMPGLASMHRVTGRMQSPRRRHAGEEGAEKGSLLGQEPRGPGGEGFAAGKPYWFDLNQSESLPSPTPSDLFSALGGGS